MRVLIYFILIIFVSSCSIQKRLDKYCPLCPTHDSTVVITKYRDTTVMLPGETIFIEDSLYCDSLGNVMSIRLAEQQGKISALESRLNKNKYRVISTVDTVYKLVKGNTIIKERTQIKRLPAKKIKYIPWWVNALSVFGGLFLLILIIYIMYKLIKNKIL